MASFFEKLFDTSDYPARWYCGNWSDGEGWLHILSDLGIASAYMAIPLVLVHFARKRRDFPFTSLFWLFASFILLCGSTHLIEAIIFWHPIYRVSGLFKLATAIVSWMTVIALIRLMPHVLHLPSLAATNRRLLEEIAKRQSIEAELRQSRDEAQRHQEELELIYAQAPVGMCLLDQEGHYLRINDHLARINGLPTEAHVGQKMADILPELNPVVWPLYQQVMSSGEPILNREVSGTTPASTEVRWWEVSYHPVKNRQGDLWAVSSITNEITERKSHEDTLLEAREQAHQASVAKSEFLANMSHEIRTPMAAILGHADVLLGHLDDPDNRNCVLTIKRNGNHLLEVINDILDLSRIEAGKLEIEFSEVSLSQIIADLDSLMRLRAEEKGLDVNIGFEGLLPETVWTDPTRLRQVLINLVGNAIKFTSRGRVDVIASLVRQQEQAWVEFRIVDTGIGIDKDQQAKLFKPFSQGDATISRDYGGTGLGLAISKRLVEMLGGELDFTSQPGQGTTFFVRIACPHPADMKLVQPTLHVKAASEEIPQPGRTISAKVLIVDDRRDIRFITQHFLEAAGACVSTANDGQQGIDLAKQTLDEGQPFDLIVMDMQMPKIDGYHATAQLRSLGIDQPIIALTAEAMRGDREKCLDAGCDDYVSKPIDKVVLVEMVARYCEDFTVEQLRHRRRERAAQLRESFANESEIAGPLE